MEELIMINMSVNIKEQVTSVNELITYLQQLNGKIVSVKAGIVPIIYENFECVYGVEQFLLNDAKDETRPQIHLYNCQIIQESIIIEDEYCQFHVVHESGTITRFIVLDEE
jgi:hypothetical protein